jgi:hypothetical protein
LETIEAAGAGFRSLTEAIDPGFPRWRCRSPRPEANSCPRSMTCYDQAAESIAERWVKVGIRVFATIYKAFGHVASIHLGNPGLEPRRWPVAAVS